MSAALALSVVGCAVLCLCLARYSRAVILERWQFVLGAPEKRAIDSLRQRMALDSALVRQALASSERSRENDRVPDALTVLRVALAILEEAGADRRTRLRAMSVYSRMVCAIRPLPVPSSAAFRGRELRALVAMASGIQRFLVGSHERFRLVLVMLRLGVGIVVRRGRRSLDVAETRPKTRTAWEDFAREVGDFEALDSSHLQAFEALVASLSAVDSDGRIGLWERISGDAR